MEIKQVYEFVNSALTETLGTEDILQEDLSNVVDAGTALFNASAVDAFIGKLVNRIGRVIFVDRKYSGSAPSVLMDAWEYGSVMEKIASEMPTVSENESWELVDGTSYDPHVFYQPDAYVKFFNKMTTFEIDRSIVNLQLKQSFTSATQLNAFVSMLFNEVDKALTVATENLIMRTINNMTAVTLVDGNVNKINLLVEYNADADVPIYDLKTALKTPSFIRYCSYRMGLVSDYITKVSTLWNSGGKQRFTPKDRQHCIMLADFKRAADVYLQSDTFHEQFTRLLEAETVPYWQASGTDFDVETLSSIKVKPIGATSSDAITQTGIIGVMFDHDALGVANFDRRVTTEYNPKAEFTNYFYKQDCRYFNDINENFVVFYAEDTAP